MDEAQCNDLAKAIQRKFPLTEEPFAQIAADLGLSEAAVLEQLRTWKAEGVLREISAVMEGAALGYDSALVCGKVPVERLEAVAEIVSQHPTVTHNYERVHDYNLWFTIAVPYSMGLDNHLRALERLTGVKAFHALRRTLTFKVGVVFDLQTKTNDTQRVAFPDKLENVEFSERERRVVRALQTCLPLEPRPFEALAREHDLNADEILEFALRHMGNAIRRYIGTFRHRKLGVRSNGMTVWRIPEDDLARRGVDLAGCSEVSHCYARNTAPDFPYTLYSMLHGPSLEHLEQTAARLSETLECEDYLILHSPTEFKKCRLRYFLPELDRWWAENR